MELEPWRPLFERERAVLNLLLTSPFPGRDELRVQVDHAQVRVIDNEGSLAFEITGPAAQVKERIPVEGYYHDGPADDPGCVVELLLHVVDGQIKELEAYRRDGRDIAIGPYEVSLDKIEVWAKS